MLTSHHIESLVARIEPDLIALRRRIDEHPELAFEEHETARAVSDYLSELDVPHRTGKRPRIREAAPSLQRTQDRDRLFGAIASCSNIWRTGK